MNFLLLLSAMLSALTGVVSSNRVERVQAAVCVCAEARQASPTRMSSGGRRPEAEALRPLLAAALVMDLRFAELVPLFASRRRE